MGCAIGKSAKVTDSTSLYRGHKPVEIVRTGDNLLNYFQSGDGDTGKPRCIFVFGSTGSQKGEFIWDLMREHLTGRDLYSFSYIDVQHLISCHIKDRVLELTGGEFAFEAKASSAVGSPEEDEDDDEGMGDNEADHDDQLDDGKDEEEVDPDPFWSSTTIRAEEVRPYLIEFSNIVSCSWIISLIEQEIAARQVNCSEKLIYLINLLPSRMNLFKNCLYLRQTPSLKNCSFDYVAVNIINDSSSKSKDKDILDQVSHTDEIITNFLNYFRNINKLVDLKVQPNQVKSLAILLSRSKRAQRVTNPQELLNVLRSEKKELYELDIRDYSTQGKLKRNKPLLFYINNEIEINDGEVLISVDPTEHNLDAIRHFAQSILKVKQVLEPNLQIAR
ncbi:hypothetical protein HDE_07069 [Halotydeus destructor]|nr:hypothetical protein HDE_07069 [Halotydeus destructor]